MRKAHFHVWLAIGLMLAATMAVFLSMYVYNSVIHFSNQQVLIAQMPSYPDGVKSGLNNIGFAKEMAEFYPHTAHFITYYGSNAQIWNSKSYIADRYVLTAQADCVWNPRDRAIQLSGEVQFYLVVIDYVSILPDGRISATSNDGSIFGLDQWKEIVEAKGDLKVIGYSLDHGAPVENFDLYRD